MMATASTQPARRRVNRAAGFVSPGLAIALGVAAAALALGFSHSARVVADRPSSGVAKNLVVVSGVSRSASGIEAGFASSSLTIDDVVALSRAGFVADATAVAPTAGTSSSVVALDRRWKTDVIGSTAPFTNAGGYSVESGREIQPEDVELSAPVVLLGQTVVNGLFSGANPVGRDVVIANRTFQVIGTFQSRGFAGAYDQDNLAVMPLTTEWKTFFAGRGNPIDQILVSSASSTGAAAAAREITNTLLSRHGILNPALADFTVTTQHNLSVVNLEAAAELKRALGLAAIVLVLVGIVHLGGLTWSRRSGGADRLMLLSDCLWLGLVSSVIGVGLAGLGAPLIHHWAHDVPTPGPTFYGTVAAVGFGAFASALAALPAILRAEPKPAVHVIPVGLGADSVEPGEREVRA